METIIRTPEELMVTQMMEESKKLQKTQEMVFYIAQSARNAAERAGLNYSDFNLECGSAENFRDFMGMIGTIFTPELFFYTVDWYTSGKQYFIHSKCKDINGVLFVETHVYLECRNNGKVYEYLLDINEWVELPRKAKCMRKYGFNTPFNSTIDVFSDALFDSHFTGARWMIDSYFKKYKLMYYLFDDTQQILTPYWYESYNDSERFAKLSLVPVEEYGSGFCICPKGYFQDDGEHLTLRHYINLDLFDKMLSRGFKIPQDAFFERSVFDINTSKELDKLEDLLYKMADERADGEYACILPLSLDTYVTIPDITDCDEYEIHNDSGSLTREEVEILKETQKEIKNLISR